MFCSQCGEHVPEDAHFCPQCGTGVVGEQTSDTTASIDLDAVSSDVSYADLPPGVAMLVVVRGPSPGTRFLLDHEVTTIGRHPEADLFLDDVTVSRNHAEIHRTPQGMQLRDLGSLNGTYIGSDRVEVHDLVTGDELQIGRFRLMFVGPGAA